MKNILITLAAVFVFSSCEDMNYMHEKYLEDGEIVYIGKVDSVSIYPGKERVLCEWKLNTDPKIQQCRIYWKNRNDSSVVEVNRSVSGPIYMQQYINVEEGEYLFEFVTEDDKGHKSLSVFKSGQSFGDLYISNLKPRSIGSVTAERDSVVIAWGQLENSVGVSFSYLNRADEERNIFVAPDVGQTIIKDYKIGGTYSYQTLYTPDETAIDTFYSEHVNANFPQYIKLNTPEWEIIEVSSEEAGGEGPVNGYATALIDGDLGTFWHSKWSGSSLPLPHTIVIDMKQSWNLASIDLWRRNNNKDTKTVQYELSEDNASWVQLGEVSFPNNPDPRNKELKLAETVSGRYLKLTVTESNNPPHASIADVFVFGQP